MNTQSSTGGAETLLRVENLTVVAGQAKRTLVREVSFDLDRGQTLGIVGESGSGKSLTARSIVGLLPQGLRSTGKVQFDGLPMLGARERVLRQVRGSRISLLLQDPFTMLNPLQTAGAHVAECLSMRRGSTRRQVHAEVRRRLDEVGLRPEVADQYPFQLSGGMRQRVALAAALARDPELLIADEPTTALDATTQDDVLRLLKQIQAARTMALVLITHDLRVAFSVCDRIQVMYAGSVVEQAHATEVQTNPLHPYSLGLMLSDPPLGGYVDVLTSIPGNVPSADEVREVCGFTDRCEWATKTCRAGRPPLVTIEAGRRSACARISQIRDELAAAAQAGQSVSAPPASQPGSPVVTLSGITKSFRVPNLLGKATTVAALHDVSFTVADGESVGLVGETGSGKTTIARTILGLNSVDAGRVVLGGIDATSYRRLSRSDRNRVRRFVQIVFQDPYASLNPALTIGSTLREALAVHDAGDATPDRVTELLQLVGLPSAYARRKPGVLSGGERQRIAIARAIATRPRLLLCDEPVAALDVSAQAQVLELLRSIRRRYTMSMLFITHDLSVVRQMADRIVVLYRGELVEAGDTAQILDNPQHPYTRRLVAAVHRSRPQQAVGFDRGI